MIDGKGIDFSEKKMVIPDRQIPLKKIIIPKTEFL